MATGDGDSVRDDLVTATALSTMPETTVSAIGVTPEYLDFLSPRLSDQQREAVEDRLEDTADQIGEMPRWSGMFAGITGGFTNPPFSPDDEATPAAMPERHAPSEGPADGRSWCAWSPVSKKTLSRLPPLSSSGGMP